MRKQLLMSIGALLAVQIAVVAQCPFSAAKSKSPCGTAAGCAAPVDAAAVEATISTDALAAILRSGVSVAVLDARTGKYDDGRRIPGAKSLASNATADQVKAAAGEKKDGLIVAYCSNLKCPASKRLATSLKKLGYTNVLEYPEGIDGWAKAGKTVAKAN
ncbi:MAG: rhodanese-like domain-containing protein [Lentisphaerae bacterium]|jgi:rhodanese-related sulfurtransferase|nr:rhodanese-like domain-containing protein [Lentisphaerota bacterium]MBT4822565.1 rhodanese-like domain-containing protein [Lentisphaerota bacterium]MBT5604741.1 rhodanese-like domain-containing protein [Lentisphaerota bacterium]MBT7058085.1 rhodanese-like domain-containing protein [Lentisphaerota bacterium]MBT7841773.1 rhodanese-like domain-containing protein [Lentisphaerota bacterium]